MATTENSYWDVSTGHVVKADVTGGHTCVRFFAIFKTEVIHSHVCVYLVVYDCTSSLA